MKSRGVWSPMNFPLSYMNIKQGIRNINNHASSWSDKFKTTVFCFVFFSEEPTKPASASFLLTNLH